MDENIEQRYTPDANPAANKFVQKLVDETVEKIVDATSPIAIYLQGSFGRGEGTVLFDDEGNPRLWRDLDLITVYRFRESSGAIAAVQEEMNQSSGVNPSETPVKGSYVSIAQLPRPVALRWRDLKMYELATNSIHLYGTDIRPDMAVQDGKIPLESGERFLLQKCMGLCKVFPYMNSEPSTVNYEVSKTYIEISSALALKEGNPSADFTERVKILEQSENSVVTKMVPRIERWGEYKRLGEFRELENLPAKESWEQAVDDLFRTFAVLLNLSEEQLPVSSNQWLHDYYNDLSGRFLSNTFSSAVASDWPPGILSGPLGTFGSLAYKIYGTLILSEERRGLLSCPLSAAYVSSLACLGSLRNESDDIADIERMQSFLNVAGVEMESSEPEEWVVDLDNAYQRASKPLYGMG